MIPLEDFFRKPEKVQFRISPLGTHLAWLEPVERRLNTVERRLNVFVQDLSNNQVKQVTGVTERDIAGVVWANNDRLVYTYDQGGDENFHLYAVDRDGSQALDLTPFPEVKVSIVDDLEDIDNEILIAMNERQREIFDVYRLDVGTGELQLVAENPGNVQTWVTDHEGRLRIATTTDGVNTSILYRPTENDDWKTVAQYNFRETVSPLFFTYDNSALYVASNLGRDKHAICEFELETGTVGKTIFEHPDVDVHQLLGSKHRKTITGVAFETDRLHFQFFEEERAEIQAFLDEKRPGYENRIVDSSRDEAQVIIHSGNDRTRGSYYLLDRSGAGMTLRHLVDQSPWLREEELCELRPIQYIARDGLAIHGYLTQPKKVGKDTPLIIHPHGGPWVRDSFGFSPEVQFLANRGYSVLQMNYRGSTGYGRAFWEAGFGEWGLKMQDDVTDSVEWAIGQGLVQADRVGIYGGSYGGYATLSGLTKTPDLYACGVSYVGISSLFTWIDSFPPYWKPFLEMVYEMVGHPEHDRARYEATSPLLQIDRLQAPLFVAQGANDPRVKREESDQLVEALRQRGVPVEYMVKDNEGHGFLNEENAFDFYRAMEGFLNQHLAPAGA